jgi:hypothetical protein
MFRVPRVLVIAALCLLASQARADRVHLVGGSVIEGKASRDGDKVVVELESGQVTLPAESVARIEQGTSAVQRFEERYAKLAAGDIKGLMALADFCRDHEMRDRERQLLLKVIETSPDHAEARARLGYVRTNAGWVTREDQMRAQGMVQHEGQWVTREQLMEIERLQAEAATAAHERDKAQTELEQKRVELERARERESDERAQASTAQAQQSQLPMTTYYAPYASYGTYPSFVPYAPYAPGWASGAGRCVGGRCSRTYGTPPEPRHAPFPIPGVRDPFDYVR